MVGYLRGFLFSAKRAMTPVRVLSGGERNRVILARLFARPSNLLVLDEPTNDLDVETLEVLEARLSDYSGTLIVVSHDREFLDNVVTSILVFEDDGKVHEYVGGYSDWLRHNHRLAEVDTAPGNDNSAHGPRTGKSRNNPVTKLSYKDQRELDALPAEIEQLEKDIAELQARTTAEDFYTQPWDVTQRVLEELERLERTLEARTERWLELEEQQEQLRR